MKQRLICGFLLCAAMYLPAASKECAKSCSIKATAHSLVKAKRPVAVPEDDLNVLPASPFSRLIFTL